MRKKSYSAPWILILLFHFTFFVERIFDFFYLFFFHHDFTTKSFIVEEIGGRGGKKMEKIQWKKEFRKKFLTRVKKWRGGLVEKVGQQMAHKARGKNFARAPHAGTKLLRSSSSQSRVKVADEKSRWIGSSARGCFVLSLHSERVKCRQNTRTIATGASSLDRRIDPNIDLSFYEEKFSKTWTTFARNYMHGQFLSNLFVFSVGYIFIARQLEFFFFFDQGAELINKNYHHSLNWWITLLFFNF